MKNLGIEFKFESIDSYHSRAKVFGGWIVKSIADVHVKMYEDVKPSEGYEWTELMVFVPDAKHEWHFCQGAEISEGSGDFSGCTANGDDCPTCGS